MRFEAVDRIFAAKKRKGQHGFFSFIVLATFGPNLADSVDSLLKKTAESFLCVYIFSSKHEGKLGEFKKVMQTLDTIKGLHSFRK